MKKSLWRQINEGIHDMCYIWWMEMKNVFKDEGVLIFFIITPLIYPLVYSWIYTNEVAHPAIARVHPALRCLSAGSGSLLLQQSPGGTHPCGAPSSQGCGIHSERV